jgi:trans-aconitate 2-methyltransferase
MDLLAQVGALPAGDVVDLGCGSGAVAETLVGRFAGRRIIGVDGSPAMLAKAAETGCYSLLSEADLRDWQPPSAPALIFSNAALHWLGNHEGLLPHLAGQLAPGGVLAVQMPRQYHQPSHRFLRDIAAAMFPDRFRFAEYEAPVRPATAYVALLAPLGEVSGWETDYVHRLPAAGAAHPVRLFTESTAMRPFLDRLTPAEAEGFVAAYEAALGAAYPLQADGSVLFPFRRVFFVLEV